MIDDIFLDNLFPFMHEPINCLSSAYIATRHNALMVVIIAANYTANF